MLDNNTVTIEGKGVANIINAITNNFLGGGLRPQANVREAKSRAEIAVIEAENKIHLSEIQKRAEKRVDNERAAEQQNLESIMLKAQPRLASLADNNPESGKNIEIDKDWVTYLSHKSRLTSDDDMQQIWANILAEEANAPSSFSKRTIDLVASLDKKDAELFTKLLMFCWNGNIPFIYDYQERIYNQHGIDFTSLNHLRDIGLITLLDARSYVFPKHPKQIYFSYDNKHIIINFSQNEDNELTSGIVMLTKAGKELVSVCTPPEPSEEYFQYVLTKWRGYGYIVTPTA